jgi:retinol dehydrogenase-12
MGCRDVTKAHIAANDFKKETEDAIIVVKKLDLSSLASVSKFANEVFREEDRIDYLINNAGIMFCPKWQTEDGFEMQFGTNHLGLY